MTDYSLTRALEDAGAARDHSPFVGLTPYGEEDADYFFGRDGDRDLVIANLMASRLTVLFGPSGVGKSSLLRAGVVRQLRNMAGGGELSYLALGQVVVVYHAAWTHDPLRGLADSLRAAIPADLWEPDLVPEGARLSVDLLGEVADRLEADIYLVCDQFEEVFLYQTGEQGNELAATLAAIVTSAVPASLLIGIRDDALAALDRFATYLPGILDNYLRLDHLSADAAREAIEGPVERYNQTAADDRTVTVEPALVEALLGQLRTGCVSVVETGQGAVGENLTIETPFLQLVMTRLWTEERRRGSRTLRAATLTELGDAEGIVRTHLDAVMASLDDDQRDLAARVFRYLVTPSGTKIAHPAEALAYFAGIEDVGRLRDVLEWLAAGPERVLRPVPPPTREPGPTQYEIFHDVMAPAVLDWRRRYVAARERVEAERELVLAKHAAEERDRRSRARLRRSRAVAAALAVLLITSLVLAYRAAQATSEADERAALAQYAQQLGTDPAKALATALGAWDSHGTDDDRLAVRSALEADHLEHVFATGSQTSSARFSPDGRKIVTASDDGVARIFDAGSARLQASLRMGRTPLRGASFSPDGSLVLVASDKDGIALFDAASGRRRSLLGSYNQAVLATWERLDGRPVILTSPQWPATGYVPALWDPAHPEAPLRTFGAPADGWHAAAASPDGRHVAAINSKQVVTVWDASSGQVVRRSASLGSAAFGTRFVGGSGRWLALSSQESQGAVWAVSLWSWTDPKAKPLRIWSGRDVQELRALGNGTLAIAVDKYGALVNPALGTGGETIVSHSAQQPDWVNSADVSPDGRWLVTGGNDGHVLVWSTAADTTQPTLDLSGHGGAVNDVEFSRSVPGLLLTASTDGTARTWRLPAQTTLKGDYGWVLSVAVSADGRNVLTAGETSLQVWQTSGRLERSTYVSGQGSMQRAAFTPAGDRIVAAGSDALSPTVWAWQTTEVPFQLSETDDYYLAGSVAVSSDGRTVAAGDWFNRVVLWDLASGKIRAKLSADTTGLGVTGIRYLPGTTRLVAASADGTVRLWDTAGGGTLVRTFGRVGDSPVYAVAVSPDGATIATASVDRGVRVWDVASGTLLRQLSVASGRLSSVAFSGDGTLLAVSASDAKVHLWTWRDGQELVALQRHGDSVNDVAFLPGSGQLVSASDDGTAAIYPCTACGTIDDVLRAARERVAAQVPGG